MWAKCVTRCVQGLGRQNASTPHIDWKSSNKQKVVDLLTTAFVNYERVGMGHPTLWALLFTTSASSKEIRSVN